MRLQNFRCLLPDTLPSTLPAARPAHDDRNPVTPNTLPREVCSTFRSLMLTSRLLNLEATELFFKNVAVGLFSYCNTNIILNYSRRS